MISTRFVQLMNSMNETKTQAPFYNINSDGIDKV